MIGLIEKLLIPLHRHFKLIDIITVQPYHVFRTFIPRPVIGPHQKFPFGDPDHRSPVLPLDHFKLGFDWRLV